MRGSEKQGKKCSDPLFHAWIFKILSYELSNFPEVWAAKWHWEKKLRKNNCRFSEKCCYKSQVFQVLSLRPKRWFLSKETKKWIYVFFLCFECGLWTDEDEDDDDKDNLVDWTNKPPCFSIDWLSLLAGNPRASFFISVAETVTTLLDFGLFLVVTLFFILGSSMLLGTTPFVDPEEASSVVELRDLLKQSSLYLDRVKIYICKS